MIFERSIEVYHGWDRRAEGAGWHGAELLFALKSAHGAITFACLTDWLPLEPAEALAKRGSRIAPPGVYPRPIDYTFHFDRPLYTSQQLQHTQCPYLAEGILCYSAPNSKLATVLRDLLIDKGSDGVWQRMEREYRDAIRIMGQAIEVE